MPDIGTAYVNIIPKAPGISSNIEEIFGGSSAQSGISKAGGKLGSLLMGAAKITAVSAVAGLGVILKESFEAGGKLQQSFGGLETIYGDAAGKAQEFAMRASAAGISANDYAEQAVSMGAALNQAFGGNTYQSMQAANTAILDMADNAAKMGTPLQSIQAAYQGFAKQNYTMLDNLKLGYGGTKEEMQRLLADAQKFSGVEYDISNLGDVYEAIHVIQQEMGLTGVAAMEANSTLSGSFGSLKASWENLMGAMATGEGMESALGNLQLSALSFAENVMGVLGNIGEQLPGMISGLLDILIEHAPDLIVGGVELLVQIGIGLVQAIPDLVAKIPEIITGIKDALVGNAQIQEWIQMGKDMVGGIIKGILGKAGELVSSLKNIVRMGLNGARDEAEIKSPSQLFAREVGQWIPAGIAMGAEENTGPLDRVMTGLIDESLTAAESWRPASAAQTGGDTDRIIEALQQLQVQTSVILEGDARGLFRSVQKSNTVRTRSTGYNALAAEV